MRKQNFSRILSVLLALLLLTQSVSLTAFAADSEGAKDVVIKSGASAEEVTAILDEAFPGEDGEWQYECEGQTAIKTWGNKSWGPIEGFTSETGKYIKTTYTHPALADNEDGVYSVRKGSGKEHKINKLAKLSANVVWNEGSYSAALTYSDDGSVNFNQLRADMFSAAVASSTPSLTVDDVTIEYYAAATSGSLGSLGKNWAPLTGGKVDGLNYPAISAGEQQVRITWGGNEDYYGFTEELTVTVTEDTRKEVTFAEKPYSVSMAYTEDGALNADAMEQAVLDAVLLPSDDLALTVSDVTIEYHAPDTVTGTSKAWVPLAGGKSGLLNLTYAAITAGKQQVRITWDGNDTYKGFAQEFDFTVVDLPGANYTLNENPTLDLAFNADQSVSYEGINKAMFDAVFASSEDLSAENVTVEYYATATTGSIGDAGKAWMPLEGGKSGLLTYPAISAGVQQVRVSWKATARYAAGSETVEVTVQDNRIASAVVLKDGVSFTYNKDVNVMKQNVLDSVIDWESSALPAKETLSVDDFTFTYNAELSVLEGASSDLIDSILNGKTIHKDVPFEGEIYQVGNTVLGSFPQIGAGEQKIQVTYKGNAEYKPSAETEGTVTINKVSVKVSVKSTSVSVSKALDLNLVTTNPEDDFNVYVIYAGITSNVTTGVYLELPARYTSSSTVIKIVDGVLAGLGQPTLTEMMQNGITVGELRELLHASEVIEALGKLGIDTGALGQIITVIDKLPAIGDNLRIAFGKPNHAGIYAVTAVTENRNYNTGVGVGALVLTADKAVLTWNQDIGKKLSAADAQTADFGAKLTINGEAVSDQSSVHVLYSGFTSKWKPYSSTTTPPTEPGRYVMTVVVLGGNYLAAPITRSFQITK